MDKNCAHAQLVTRDGEIEITVSALHRRTHVYIYTRNAHAHVMPRAMGANNVRVHEE